MTPSRRKGVGEQAQEKLKPDSQKTYTEFATDKATGLADKAAGAVQPGMFTIDLTMLAATDLKIEGEKSTTQKMSDSTRGTADDAQDGGASLLDQAKGVASSAVNTASEYLDSASKSISDAIDSVSESSTAHPFSFSADRSRSGCHQRHRQGC